MVKSKVDTNDKTELIKLTNKLFDCYIQDICNTYNITRYRMEKDLNLSHPYLYNKNKGYSIHFVSLPVIYKISMYYNFEFSLLKYANQIE